VVVEEELFEGTGIELAIVGEFQIDRGFSIRLAASFSLPPPAAQRHIIMTTEPKKQECCKLSSALAGESSLFASRYPGASLRDLHIRSDMLSVRWVE